jgi:hypothetical protein
MIANACETRDSVFARHDPVTLTRGSAVNAWDAAQRLVDSGGETSLADAAPPDAAPIIADAARATDAAVASDDDAAMASDAAVAVVDAGPSAPLVFRVTTLSQGGQFEPKNIGAIWIQDAGGKWVKTLAIWAGVSTRYLTHYCAANTTGNKVDAMTSATLPMQKAHEVTWDLTDCNRKSAPDGDYSVMVEVTDHNGTGQTLSVPFKKGAEAMMIAPANDAAFSDIQLRFAGEK